MRSGQKKEDLNTTSDVKKSEQLQKKVTGAHKEVDLNMFQSRPHLVFASDWYFHMRYRGRARQVNFFFFLCVSREKLTYNSLPAI